MAFPLHGPRPCPSYHDRFLELAENYNANSARGMAVLRRALEAWHQKGLLPDLGDPEMASRLCLSLLSDQVRIRVAMGQPMATEEQETHISAAVGLFLRGCGYRV